ncbi:MAG: biopolymer transporter ExbD [Deltaproteobacteria bacterium]|nr:biopolymer transporter ExbD [Deltaproteobacteria bacterium]
MSINVREARSIIRKAVRRVPEGESIGHLNLTAMMDMMSILLVFMIKSMTSSTSTLNIRDITLPPSTTRMTPPEEAVSVVIAKSAILAEGEPVVAVKNGDVDPSEKTQGSFGIEIGKLTTILAKHHTRIKKIAAVRGEEPAHELTIMADKETPYRLLVSVIYSAGQSEFQNYRMIVLRNDE